MFALFFSLYYSMFAGSWLLFTRPQINTAMTPLINSVGELITSIFGEFQVTNLGTILHQSIHLGGEVYVTPYMCLIAYILALITCIGIVVMAVKGIKKVFGIFFGQIR